MKKNILVLFAIVLNFTGAGQFKKDDALLGLNGGYSRNKNNSIGPGTYYDSHSDQMMRGNARFGYFFRNGFVLGLLGGHTKTISKVTTHSQLNLGEQIDESTYTGKEYSIGAFSRFYKTIAENKLAFFCQLDVVYVSGITEGKHKGNSGGLVTFTREPNGEIKGVTAGLRPGFVYFIRRRIGIEVSFGTFSYDYRIRKNYLRGLKLNENRSGGLNMNFGLTTFNMGVNFYLCEKK